MNAPEERTAYQTGRRPLSPGQALIALPGQYLSVFFRPSITTFVEVTRKAHWMMNLVQMILYTLSAILLVYFIITFLHPNAYFLPSLTAATYLLPLLFNIGSLWGTVILFGGTGTMTAHCHALLLIWIPFGIISLFVYDILPPATILLFPLSIYCIVLQVYAIRAVHNLSGGKAVVVVLIGGIVASIVWLLVRSLLSPLI